MGQDIGGLADSFSLKESVKRYYTNERKLAGWAEKGRLVPLGRIIE
jgi:hypothetical protein